MITSLIFGKMLFIALGIIHTKSYIYRVIFSVIVSICLRSYKGKYIETMKITNRLT